MNFEVQLFRKVCWWLGNVKTCTPLFLLSDGLVERFHLPLVLWAYRAAVQ